MKTGTISFHASNNNGSFLQAYALQRVLINQCYVDNEIAGKKAFEQDVAG